MTAAPCTRCGATAMRVDAKFCDECGSPVTQAPRVAEYKQVTVLFADVVHSMDIARAVGAERLREIMAGLLDRATAVVGRYEGMVDKFTGDGMMAVFGAPVALEDHALRACRAALEIHTTIGDLAEEVSHRDGVQLQLRVGLNSGQVIAGQIGSGTAGYTAIGEQVGMAQRMESVAPPGGVMLSTSTARLVEGAMVLGEPQGVHIKGNDQPVAARRLLGADADRGRVDRREPGLVGRAWEINAVAAILDEAAGGTGCVAAVVGPPGIGKSRIVREAVKLATHRGVEVFTAFCESHTREVPFYVVTRLLRSVFGISELDPQAARTQVRARIPDANPEDLTLLEDLLGIGDPAVAPPDIAPDARRRRLAALLNAAALARTTPVVYVIEDLHWVDEATEAMLAEFFTVVPQCCALVLITHRPEYRGALSRTPGAQTISLAPLNPAHSASLTAELLGPDPSVRALAERISERAAGNPFFAEEIVRDLSERGVLEGDHGDHVCRGEVADISVPDTLQATIAARVDRLAGTAKQFLYAAAVIGLRFGSDLVTELIDDGDGSVALAELVQAELIDQVMFTPRAEYGFRHPLIQTVAYESQLKSGRAQLHRRMAAAIEARDPASADENAALIAEHLEAAGALHAAYGWHMRAGAWSAHRDIRAARASWLRARQVADRLPADDSDRTAMRIAPRTLLCGTAWQSVGSVADTGFDELRDLCVAADDKVSLAVGMFGYIIVLGFHNRHHEVVEVTSEHIDLLESIGDPTLIVGLLSTAIYTEAVAGHMVDGLRLAQRIIDLADGDPTMGNLIMGSPLSIAIVLRGLGKMCLGMPGWRDDFDEAVMMAAAVDPMSHVLALFYKYMLAIPIGALSPDGTALRETAEALGFAEQSGDDFTLTIARLTRGLVLVRRGGPGRSDGFDLLAQVRGAALNGLFTLATLPMIDSEFALEKARTGDLDGAIEVARAAVDDTIDAGQMVLWGRAASVFAELLLQRDTDRDQREAQTAIERLAAAPTDPGYVLHELPLLRLRALLARAQVDEDAYRDYRDRYRKMATDLGFEGHMKLT